MYSGPLTPELETLLDEYEKIFGEDVGLISVNSFNHDQLVRRLKKALKKGKAIPWSDKSFYIKDHLMS